MNVVAIIQARMASSRLPGKVLADIGGQPALWHVVDRARSARTIDAVVVATSDTKSDDIIAQWCGERGIRCLRGSERDVLDRYHQAAVQCEADVVVRLTADCPLLHPELIDQVVRTLLEGDYHYASNTIVCTYPDGLDVEAFRREALEEAWRRARLPSEREHVTPYLRKHPEQFRLACVRHETDLSDMRWTLDEPKDLEFLRAVLAHLGPSSRGMADVLRVLQDHPELAAINQGIKRNEGYATSLREDRQVEASARP